MHKGNGYSNSSKHVLCYWVTSTGTFTTLSRDVFPGKLVSSITWCLLQWAHEVRNFPHHHIVSHIGSICMASRGQTTLDLSSSPIDNALREKGSVHARLIESKRNGWRWHQKVWRLYLTLYIVTNRSAVLNLSSTAWNRSMPNRRLVNWQSLLSHQTNCSLYVIMPLFPLFIWTLINWGYQD